MTAKNTEVSTPSLGDFLLEVQRQEESAGGFALEAPDLLRVVVDGRLRARAAAVLAASGQVRITPASRFASLSGKDESAGLLAAVDGKGAVLLGESGKTITLLRLRRDEALVVAPHAVLALEETVNFSPLPIRLPLRKPIEWNALVLKGPGRLAFTMRGTLHTLRVGAGTPVFARTGSVVAWTANLAVIGRAGSAGDTRVAFAGDGYLMIQAGQEPR